MASCGQKNAYYTISAKSELGVVVTSFHLNGADKSILLKELSQVVDIAKPHLDNWYRECLLFVVNCVQVLGKDIKYIIYNVSVDNIILLLVWVKAV